MTELPDEERAIVNNLSVQGLSIRLEYAFHSQLIVKRDEFAEKPINLITHNFCPKILKFNIGHVGGGDPLGLKCLLRVRDESTEKYVET